MEMKILHAGFPNPSFGRAFSRVSEYRFVDWGEWTSIPNNTSSFQKYFLDLAVEFKPDIIFLQIQSDGVIGKYCAQALSDICPIINWTWDFRRPIPTWYIDLAPYVISAFTNEEDVELLNAAGHRAVYLPTFDSDTYTPVGSKTESPDIVFMGNNYPKDDYDFPLADYRIDVVNALSERFGDAFNVFGFGWPNRNPLNNFMHRELKEAACYRGCKIGINISHYMAERYSSDRILRLMGSGAFCLTHKYPGMDKDFVDGKHLVSWDNIQELLEKAEYYLNNEKERIDIAKEGCDLVHSNYSLARFVEKIISYA